MAIDTVKLSGQVDVDATKAEAELAAFDAAASAAASDKHGKIFYSTDVNGIIRARNEMGQFVKVAKDAENAVGGGGGGGPIKGASNAFGEFSGAVSGASGAGMSFIGTAAGMILKVAAFAEVIPLAASGLVALGGAAVGATAAIAPLVGVLGALPGALSGAATGVGALILGFSGISDALGAWNKASQPVFGAQQQMASAAFGVTQALWGEAQAQRALNQFVAQYPENVIKKQLDYKDAVLGQKQAVLDLQRAQLRLTEIQQGLGNSVYKSMQLTDAFTGKIYDVAVQGNQAAEKQLDLQQANLDVAKAQDAVTAAQLRTKDSQRDLNKFTRGGMKATQDYKDLLHQLITAEHGVIDAQNALKSSGGASQWFAYNQALQKLSPAGREFVKFLESLKPKFEELKHAAQEGLLPGVEKGIKAMLPLFPLIEGAVSGAAKMFGTLATNIGNLVGGKSFRTDLAAVFKDNAKFMGESSKGIVAFIDGIRQIAAVAAQSGLGKFFGGLVKEAGQFFDAWAKAGRATGQLAGDFSETKKAIKDFIAIFHNVFDIFDNVLKAALPLGDWMRGQWVTDTKHMADETQKNIGPMTKWFNSLKQPIHEIAKFVADLGRVIFNVGNHDMAGFTATLQSLDQKFLPALQNALNRVDWTKLGPALADALSKVAGAFGALLSHNNSLIPFVKSTGLLAEAIGKIVDAMPDWMITGGLGAIFAFKAASNTLGTLGGIAGKINTIVGLAGDMKQTGGAVGFLAAKFPSLMNVVGKAGGLFARLGPMLMNPWVLGGAAVIALVVLIVKYHKQIWNFLKRIWNDIWRFLKGTWETIKSVFSDAWNWVYNNVIKKVGDLIVSYFENWTLVGLLYKHWDQIKHDAGAAWDWVKNKVQGFVTWIKGVPNTIWNFLKNMWEREKEGARIIWDWIKSHIQGVVTWIGGIPHTVLHALSGMWNFVKSEASSVWGSVQGIWNGMIRWIEGLPSRIASAASNMWHGITDAFKAAINFVIGIWDKLHFTIGGWKVGYGPVHVTVPKVEVGMPYIPPFKALGGTVEAFKPYIVGERRPELFIPNQPGRIMPTVPHHGETGITHAQLKRLLNTVMEKAKADVKIDQTFNEKADPRAISSELAWRLSA